MLINAALNFVRDKDPSFSRRCRAPNMFEFLNLADEEDSIFIDSVCEGHKVHKDCIYVLLSHFVKRRQQITSPD